MIHPSYVDLMKVVNQGVEEGEEPVISSRYSIVMATARRARQLVAGDEPLVENTQGRKALSVAVEELNEDRIKILTDEEKAEMEIRRAQENDRSSFAAQDTEDAPEETEASYEEAAGSDATAETAGEEEYDAAEEEVGSEDQ